jgi:hypothetical protein
MWRRREYQRQGKAAKTGALNGESISVNGIENPNGGGVARRCAFDSGTLRGASPCRLARVASCALRASCAGCRLHNARSAARCSPLRAHLLINDGASLVAPRHRCAAPACLQHAAISPFRAYQRQRK